MEAIKFNFKPGLAVEAVRRMSEGAHNDQKAEESTKKIWEDIETLVQLGFAQLSEKPMERPTNNN